MNAPHPTRLCTSDEFDCVRNDHYVFREEDFANGCFYRFNPDTGVCLATGETKFGLTVTVPLDTPLCGGCDQPIPANGVCDSCRCIHVDVAR